MQDLQLERLLLLHLEEAPLAQSLHALNAQVGRLADQFATYQLETGRKIADLKMDIQGERRRGEQRDRKVDELEEGLGQSMKETEAQMLGLSATFKEYDAIHKDYLAHKKSIMKHLQGKSKRLQDCVAQIQSLKESQFKYGQLMRKKAERNEIERIRKDVAQLQVRSDMLEARVSENAISLTNLAYSGGEKDKSKDGEKLTKQVVREQRQSVRQDENRGSSRENSRAGGAFIFNSQDQVSRTLIDFIKATAVGIPAFPQQRSRAPSAAIEPRSKQSGVGREEEGERFVQFQDRLSEMEVRMAKIIELVKLREAKFQRRSNTEVRQGPDIGILLSETELVLGSLRSRIFKLQEKLEASQSKLVTLIAQRDESMRRNFQQGIHQLQIRARQSNSEIQSKLQEVRYQLDRKADGQRFKDERNKQQQFNHFLEEQLVSKPNKPEVKRAINYLEGKLRQLIAVVADRDASTEAFAGRSKCLSCEKGLDESSVDKSKLASGLMQTRSVFKKRLCKSRAGK